MFSVRLLIFSIRAWVILPVFFLTSWVNGQAGWSFDTSASPEEAAVLLAQPDSAQAPQDSWLRIRGLAHSAVLDTAGKEVPLWTGACPEATVSDRRAALSALQAHGYRLIAVLQWSSRSWSGGFRPDQPYRRLPLDLREAAQRCRQLAETYGDLIDTWEIENEPDISFVEENPETYVAFLKACYLGVRLGRTGVQPPPSASQAKLASSSVLMAAFALPPGPYFNAWVANDGLRYTDGFNYHFYGYAEDFTGVYRQFEAAVMQARVPTPADESVWETCFYPPGSGWKTRIFSRFAAAEGDTSLNREWLQTRPLATHEPVLELQGRWLVSTGNTVREIADGWEFTVSKPGLGPGRPARAELPLPRRGKFPGKPSLAFEYKLETATAGSVEPTTNPPPSPSNERRSVIYPKSSSIPDDPGSPVSNPQEVAARKLPVFITEYGFGLLKGEAGRTPDGREAQRAWFENTTSQARELGIARALAFNFKPDYTVELGEFGLLMTPANEPPEIKLSGTDHSAPKAGLRTLCFPGYAISPAFSWLLNAGERPVESRDWPVTTHSPTPVVIDFVADQKLTMVKTSCGYFLPATAGAESKFISTEPGDANRLILYNFSSRPVAGELSLEGSWRFHEEPLSRSLILHPGERREIPVEIQLAPTGRYQAHRAAARFKQHAAPLEKSSGPPIVIAPLSPPAPTPQSPPPEALKSSPITQGTPVVSAFEVYVRTDNGNLYQTWPRLSARDTWQWYVESFENFTPAFYGRAHWPAGLADNSPAALVFFFRPDHYPTTYRIRRACVTEFVAPEAAATRQSAGR